MLLWINGSFGGVPMMVVEPEYLRDTVGRLRARSHDVRHFVLLAERETITARLDTAHRTVEWCMERRSRHRT